MSKIKFASAVRFWARVAQYSPPILAMAILSQVLMVLGLVLVPVGILLATDGKGRYPSATGYIRKPPSWLWLWGNDQEGYRPPWYRDLTPGWGEFRRQYVWAAWRNPVNNLRFVPWINPRVRDPELTESYVCGNCVLRTCGPFARILYSAEGGDLMIGWKISDIWDMGIQRAVWGEYLPWGFGIRYRRHK